MLLGGCKNITEGQAEAGAVGSACAEAGDCDKVEQAVCLKMPSGYCSAECAGGAFDCDEQSLCQQLGDQAFFCLDGCLTENGSGDCRDQYRCSARADAVNFDGREIGVCIPKCESDGDCGGGERCDTGSGNCVARGEKRTGEGCSNNAQCNGGLCLINDTFRGGYCSARCGNQFAECENGSECTTLEGEAICLTSCDADADCREGEGYKCRQVGVRADQNGDDRPVKICVPRCQSNAECGDGSHCDANTGDCKEGVGAPNAIGEFCAANGDCASGQCLSGDRYLNGLCAADCGGGCDDGTTCGATPDGQKCLASCNADLDCRAGYICAEGACAPPCANDSECAGDLKCGASGRCVEPAASGADVQTINLGSVSVGGQLSDDVTLDVPEGTLGFSIIGENAGSDLMIIGRMVDPNGRTIYDFQNPFGSEVRFFPSTGEITQMVPSSPRSAPIPGRYVFNLIKEGGTRNINVSAILKTAQGEPQAGELNVNFFFANIGLDASSAKADGDFQAAVTELRALYAQRDIVLGDVNYCNLGGGDADRYAVIDTVEGANSELNQMFALSGKASELGCSDEQALNFFLVQEIVGGRAGYIILGVSGGIPGPPGLHGTTHSGVAVTMSGFRRNPKQLAQTMAHEGGHYLGLFHTTEAEGNAFDPLPDTPQCTADRDRDGVVSYAECQGEGADNLMFWAAGDNARKVSNDQGFVVLRNPAVK